MPFKRRFKKRFRKSFKARKRFSRGGGSRLRIGYRM